MIKPSRQIDVAEGAMTLRGHHRLADDVGEIGADGEIPMQSRLLARRARR